MNHKPEVHEVTYTVKFRCKVTVEPGSDLSDLVSDINIPEDDVSEYVANSFKILNTKDVTDDVEYEKEQEQEEREAIEYKDHKRGAYGDT